MTQGGPREIIRCVLIGYSEAVSSVQENANGTKVGRQNLLE